MARETIGDEGKRVSPAETALAGRIGSEPEAREAVGPFKGVGPKGYARSDAGIRDEVSERLMENGNIDASDIEVSVLNADVILTGSVRTDDERRSAERMALLVRGVQNVTNRLQVKRDRAAGETAATAPAGATPAGAVGQPERRGRAEGTRKVGRANIAVFGIYRDRSAAEGAVEALKTAGFRNTDLSILFSENAGTKDFAFDKATKAPEGVVVGAGSGIVVGGILGWLASIGLLAVPGIGPFLAAGPIVSVLAGMGLAGTVGGIAGALAGMGMPEYEAKRYEGRVKRGHVLISVHADDRIWADRAEKVLDRTGGEDISRTGEKSADFGATNKPLPRGEEYRED